MHVNEITMWPLSVIRRKKASSARFGDPAERRCGPLGTKRIVWPSRACAGRNTRTFHARSARACALSRSPGCGASRFDAPGLRSGKFFFSSFMIAPEVCAGVATYLSSKREAPRLLWLRPSLSSETDDLSACVQTCREPHEARRFRRGCLRRPACSREWRSAWERSLSGRFCGVKDCS